MSVQHEQTVTRAIVSERRPLSRSIAEAFLRRILRVLERGHLVVETPAGDRLVFEGVRPGPQARITVHRWRCLWRLATGSDIGFAEAYMAGDWSSPNLAALLNLAAVNCVAEESMRLIPSPSLGLKLRHALNRNTRRGSRRNIAAHYDLGNEFYEQWLDAGMSYSSGIYSPSVQTLEEAQDAKLDRITDLLSISGGEQVLEIGCGWGGMAERLLKRSDCSLTALTLSAEQLAFTRQRLGDAGLLARSDVRLQDYRDVSGTFDRIVSIEMLEAVGEAYWPTYFETLRERLRPGGAAVLQVITIDDSKFEFYRSRPDFIQKYIFPGGMLPTTQIIEREAQEAGLELVASELFPESYARTLEAWHRRFNESWSRIEAMGFDQRFKRTWEYYLAYCQAGFETGALSVGLYKLVRPDTERVAPAPTSV